MLIRLQNEGYCDMCCDCGVLFTENGQMDTRICLSVRTIYFVFIFISIHPNAGPSLKSPEEEYPSKLLVVPLNQTCFLLLSRNSIFDSLHHFPRNHSYGRVNRNTFNTA